MPLVYPACDEEIHDGADRGVGGEGDCGQGLALGHVGGVETDLDGRALARLDAGQRSHEFDLAVGIQLVDDKGNLAVVAAGECRLHDCSLLAVIHREAALGEYGP